VSVGGEIVSSIGAGLCLLVGVEPSDGHGDVMAAVDKMAGLRVFGDEAARLNLSVVDVGGAILLVSQFTLLGDARRGRRPSFTGAAPAESAEPIIDAMARAFAAKGIAVETGVFGASMDVELVNEGPVTLVLDISDGRVL
jgi:D-tyrosyl-tRNA(Tyr) deacylase